MILMQGLSKYLIFEITRELSLKNILRLSGVCKELNRKIYFKNASGIYICLRKTGAEEQKRLNNNFMEQIFGQTIKKFM